MEPLTQNSPEHDDAPTGWDPLSQGTARFAGAIPSKKGPGGSRLLYFTSHNEEVAALVAEMSWFVTNVGRGDVSDNAARLRGITGPDGQPRFPLRYVFEGEAHWYLPDYVARGAAWAGDHALGAQYIIEGGCIREKAGPQELAKLAAAREIVARSGGIVIVVDAEHVPARWYRNALTLHLRRFDYQGPTALLARIRGIWSTRRVSIADVVADLGAAHDPRVVEAAAFKVAGDLLAEGRLDVALESAVFSRSTRVSVVAEALPPNLPPGIVTDLEDLVRIAGKLGGPISSPEPLADKPKLSSIDPGSIADQRTRDEFLRRRAAIVATVRDGVSTAQAARDYGLEVRRFQQLKVAFGVAGEAALLPHATYERPKFSLPDDVAKLIEQLHVRSERLGPTAIAEHRDLHALSRKLGLPRTPSVRQVRGVIRQLEKTSQAAREARAGRALVPSSVAGRSIDVEMRPGFLCELDEATMDVKAVALAGAPATIRLHLGAIVCVGTRMPLSMVVSPKALDQWDYRRLLLRAIVAKEALTNWATCTKKWNASAIPVILRADHGKINTCHLVFQAASDLAIALEFAPVRDAHGKPFIESFFGGLKREFEHRLTITTKSSPADRGLHDPDREAVRLRVTPEQVEQALIRYMVDAYSQSWHKKLREVPASVWNHSAQQFGVRTWQGEPDELRRLLKRDEGERKVERHGISYRGRWYGSPLLGSHGRETVRIKVDEDDMRALDVYDTSGKLLCAALCGELSAQGRPISRWELDLADELAKKLGSPANDAALEASHDIARQLLDRKKGDLAKFAGRRKHHERRAKEVMDDSVRDVLRIAESSPAAPKRVVPETLAAAVADEEVYDVLIDETTSEVPHVAA
jgi:transposase InsO family protein